MKYLRKHIAIRFLFGLLALHILNVSVDPPDPFSHEVAEDLFYNEMESIIELILEKGMNIKDAMPENDDDDSPFHFKFEKEVDFFFYNLTNTNKTAVCSTDDSSISSKLIDFSSSDFIRNIAQPPEV